MDKVSPGTSLSESPLEFASFVNDLIEVVDVHNGVTPPRPGQNIPAKIEPPEIIRVKNSTGGDLLPGHVVQLGDYLLTAFRRKDMWIDGVEPADIFKQMAVLIDPIKDGKIGRATVGRIVVAKYDDADGTPAEKERWGVMPGETVFKKGYPGFRVHRLVEVGEESFVIAFREDLVHLVGKAGSPIAALSSATPGSGSVTVWIFDGTEYVETEISVTGRNLSTEAVAADKFLQLKLDGDAWLVDFESCGA